MDAFGEQLHLELKRNTKFMAPGLQLEKREKNGKITKTQVSRDSYFRGNVISDPGSFVALSVNDGLVRKGWKCCSFSLSRRKATHKT